MAYTTRQRGVDYKIVMSTQSGDIIYEISVANLDHISGIVVKNSQGPDVMFDSYSVSYNLGPPSFTEGNLIVLDTLKLDGRYTIIDPDWPAEEHRLRFHPSVDGVMLRAENEARWPVLENERRENLEQRWGATTAFDIWDNVVQDRRMRNEYQHEIVHEESMARTQEELDKMEI